MAGAGGREVGRISIRVTPNLDGFRRKVLREVTEVENSLAVDVDVNPNTQRFRQRVQAATTGLTADVDLDVKRGALGRIRDALSRIEGPSFGSGINPTGYAAIFAGIAAVAAPVMGLLTTSLLALPGLLAAVVAPVGAIALGLDGIKAAASRLTEPFAALRATMSEFTEAQFTPVFDKLGAIFQMLSNALPAVSQGVADMATAFVDTITSSSGMSKIETTIDNIAAALTKAAPGIGAFTDGLLSLATTLSGKLPDLSGWFNGAGKSFSEWVQRITADGTLSKAFDGLGGTLKTLLEALGGLASEGMKFFEDPSNIQDFNNGLKSIGESLQSIVTLSNTINNAVDNLFGNMLPTFDFESIKQDLTAPFTSADAPWRDYAAGISEAFNSVRATVASAMASVAQAVSGVGAQIAGAWNGVVSAAQSAWNTVVSTVTGAIASAVAAVVSGGSQILAEVSSWPGKISGAVGNMGGILVGAGKALMDGLLSGIRSGLQAVLDFASGIADKIASVKGPLPYDRRVLTPAGEAMMHGLDAGLQNGFTSVLDRARGMADELAGAFGPQKIETQWGADFDPGKLVNAGADFAMANGQQFAEDLGIGGGALTAAAGEGVGFLTQMLSGIASKGFGDTTTIQVNSVDEAVSAQSSITAKKALQYYRR